MTLWKRQDPRDRNKIKSQVQNLGTYVLFQHLEHWYTHWDLKLAVSSMHIHSSWFQKTT